MRITWQRHGLVRSRADTDIPWGRGSFCLGCTNGSCLGGRPLSNWRHFVCTSGNSTDFAPWDNGGGIGIAYPVVACAVANVVPGTRRSLRYSSMPSSCCSSYNWFWISRFVLHTPIQIAPFFLTGSSSLSCASNSAVASIPVSCTPPFFYTSVGTESSKVRPLNASDDTDVPLGSPPFV